MEQSTEINSTSQPVNSTIATGECNDEIIPDAMEEGTETKVVSPENSTAESARNTSVQHEQVPQPHSQSQLPSTVGLSSVAAADTDHDEDSSSGSEVDLSGCLTVQEFVENHSAILPVNVIAIRNEIQREYSIHCIEQRTVLRIEDKFLGNNFNVPINSRIKFGIVYNPHGNDREASRGYEFATVSDILKLKHFPAVVVVTKDFSNDFSGSPSVKEHEVLIVRETSTQKRYLRVYSLLTNSTKDLPEHCAGCFCTNPAFVRMCASDIIQYIFPQPFPCQAVMYVPSNNQDMQIPCNLSNVITISDSRIEKSLVASEVGDTTGTCIRIPLECSSKTTIIVPEVTHSEECNHATSGEVVYAQPKKKGSQPAAIATGECDYDIIPEEISSPLAELDAHAVLQSSKKSEKKKKHHPFRFMQRALQRQHSRKKNKRESRPVQHRDSDHECAIIMNRSYTPNRPLPREPYTMSSNSIIQNNDPIAFPNACYVTTHPCIYDVIPGGVSLHSGKGAYVPTHHCPPQPNVPTHHCLPEPSESTGLTDTNTDTSSGNDLDPYEAIPGAASPQPANTTCVHYQPEATPSANECEYEDETALVSLICNSNGDEATETSFYETPELSPNTEPSESIVNAQTAVNQHMITKGIGEQLNYLREEINGRMQVVEDQLKHHREESREWMQELEGRLMQLQQAQEANNSESKLSEISEYLASRADFVAEDTNMQKIQSMFEHLNGDFRRRLDSFEQQLGEQQNWAYEYIASQSCNGLHSDATEAELRSNSQGQDLQKVHSMLEHLTVVTAQTGESMSESYVQFTKRFDSIEQRLEQQKGIYEPYRPDCQSKETVLEPSLCTVQDDTPLAIPNETPPLYQPQVKQWIDVMTELHTKLEKQLMERMESFEQKLTEQQNLMHSSFKQLAEQQSSVCCHTPQAANQGRYKNTGIL